MSEPNKAVVRRFIDLYNEGAWEQLDAIVEPGYVHHSNDQELTWEQFKRGAAWIRRGLPDFRLEIVDMVAEGDRVAARMIGRGTHLGSLLGEEPTSSQIVLHVIALCRLGDGRYLEDWEAMDEHDLLRQIGALPPTP